MKRVLQQHKHTHNSRRAKAQAHIPTHTYRVDHSLALSHTYDERQTDRQAEKVKACDDKSKSNGQRTEEEAIKIHTTNNNKNSSRGNGAAAAAATTTIMMTAYTLQFKPSCAAWALLCVLITQPLSLALSLSLLLSVCLHTHMHAHIDNTLKKGSSNNKEHRSRIKEILLHNYVCVCVDPVCCITLVKQIRCVRECEPSSSSVPSLIFSIHQWLLTS